MALDLWAVWSYGLVFLLGALMYYLSGWFRAVRFVMQLPGPPALPVLGNTLLVSDHERLLELGRTGYKEYGVVYRAWLTIIPAVVLYAPEHVQVILSSNKNTEKMYFYSLLHNFLGKGLITNSGQKWRFHRRVIQPSFHLSILESFIQTFHSSANILVDNLKQRTDLSSVNVTTPVNECILNILHDAVLGIPMTDESENLKDSPFRQGKVVAPYRVVHPWLLLNSIYKLTDLAKNELQQQKKLFQFTTNIVRERLKAMQNQGSGSDCSGSPKKKPFVDFMIEISSANEAFSEEDVVHELCTFMLAGQDSVGAALAFALFELAKNQDVQELVVQELDAVFGDDNRAPTMNDLRQLKYLEQCVKETLRLYPSVPFVMRTLTEDAVIGKYTVPAGSGVILSPYATHHLPDIYPDPDKFDPDRFLPEKVESRHPYAYIPFSAGPRNCIGHKFAIMELKTVLATILRSYRLSSVSGHETLKLTYRITLRVSGGIWVCFTPRVQSNC